MREQRVGLTFIASSASVITSHSSPRLRYLSLALRAALNCSCKAELTRTPSAVFTTRYQRYDDCIHTFKPITSPEISINPFLLHNALDVVEIIQFKEVDVQRIGVGQPRAANFEWGSEWVKEAERVGCDMSTVPPGFVSARLWGNIQAHEATSLASRTTIVLPSPAAPGRVR